jgi:hypothetical protein
MFNGLATRNPGQLGVDLNTLLSYQPPNLSTSYFTSQNTRPATNPISNATPPAGYRTPPYVQPTSGSGGTSLRLNDVFGTSAGLASQLISAFGRRESTQITGSPNVQAIVSPGQVTPYGQAGLLPPAQLQPFNPAAGGVGAGALSTATGFLDGIAQSFGISTTMLALFGAAGIYLLFRTPPRR